MRKLFFIDRNPSCSLWDFMWSSRTIEQEINACDIETAPRVMFLSYLPKNGKIIDAGCGFGKWVIYLTKRGYNIKGIDNNKSAINKLKNYDESLQVEHGDILNLEYPDNYFDAYISMGVIEHFEDGPIPALKEAFRVLKPNGLIFVSTPVVNIIRKIVIKPILNYINRLYFLFKLVNSFLEKSRLNNSKSKNDKKKKGKRKKYFHFNEYRFTPEELQSFLKQSNFKVLRTVPHDFSDSKNHNIGLGVDFPFLKIRNSVNFEMNFFGKLISRIFDRISPWFTSASVLCIGRSLKK